MALLQETPLGPYEVLEILGSGGIGEVHRARDTRVGREVAIEVLSVGACLRAYPSAVWSGGVMLAKSGLVAIALAVGLLCAGGCARNPPPATPAATPAPTSDKVEDQIHGAVDEAARRLERDDLLELPPGTEQDLGGLHFDPQGADFTLWIDAFKREVYRHWIVPQEAQSGARGHVNFEFTVERNGSTSALRMLKSSGTASFDQAAQGALSAGKFTTLPNDYGPPRVTMRVTFFYNEPPK